MTVASMDLFSHGIHLHEDGSVTAGERQMDSDPGGWQIAAFRARGNEDVHPDHWEMHPEADELVAVLSGTARIYFRPVPEAAATDDDEGDRVDDAASTPTQQSESGAEESATLAAGRSVIVPRGRWHRLELDGPGNLMSVTLRRGTRLEKRR